MIGRNVFSFTENVHPDGNMKALSDQSLGGENGSTLENWKMKTYDFNKSLVVWKSIDQPGTL